MLRLTLPRTCHCATTAQTPSILGIQEIKMALEEKNVESPPKTPEEIERQFKKVFGRDMTPVEKKIFMFPPELPKKEE